MRLLQWVARTFTFAQFDPDGGGGGNPYVDDRPTAGGPDSSGSGSRPDRPDNDVVGGYAYRPTTTGYAYGSIPFTPYRQNDLRHVIQQAINQGTILDLQDALMAAGLLTGDVLFGVVDSATEDALESLLTIANQNGLDWRDVLSQASAGGGVSGSGGGGGGGGGLGPTVIQLPNRDDLIAAWDETGFALTGENLDDDLSEAAVEAVLDSLRTQQERQVQSEMGASGPGAFFTESAPDVNRLLEEEVRARAPQKVMNKQARDAMDIWFDILGGGPGT